MNADDFRRFYEYHFSENRKMWNSYITSLSQEQFTQSSSYSYGSIRNQIVHVMTVDNAWFSDLRGHQNAPELNPPDSTDRDIIRAFGDAVETRMRAYLADLNDDMLSGKPLQGEDANLIMWQVLLHVANHATDHRAQMLRLLNDMGVKTGPQDYVFYLYDHP